MVPGKPVAALVAPGITDQTVRLSRAGEKPMPMRSISRCRLPSLGPGVLLAAMVALAGCGGSDDGPAANQSQAITEPAAPAIDLSDHVGRYPPDVVDGAAFFAVPAVRAAVEAAVPDAEVRGWIFDKAGPQSPIALVGDRLSSFGCETHNCGDHNWVVLIDKAATKAEVCYRDAETMVGAMAGQSRWYAAGKAEMRPGECPSE